MIYGSIPAGGKGSRLQPIGFSKELALIGRKAVIEYLIERMVLAGINNIFINTAADKNDLISYLAKKSRYRDKLIFTVKARKGLQDGILTPAKFLKPSDVLYFGLPDTIWFPRNGFSQLRKFPKGKLTLGLFNTPEPEKFDSVVIDDNHRVKSIAVKSPKPSSSWIWGIGRVHVSAAAKLNILSAKQKLTKPLFGVSMNAYAQSFPTYGICLDKSNYIDIGRKSDYERALDMFRNSLA